MANPYSFLSNLSGNRDFSASETEQPCVFVAHRAVVLRACGGVRRTIECWMAIKRTATNFPSASRQLCIIILWATECLSRSTGRQIDFAFRTCFRAPLQLLVELIGGNPNVGCKRRSRTGLAKKRGDFSCCSNRQSRPQACSGRRRPIRSQTTTGGRAQSAASPIHLDQHRSFSRRQFPHVFALLLSARAF